MIWYFTAIPFSVGVFVTTENHRLYSALPHMKQVLPSYKMTQTTEFPLVDSL